MAELTINNATIRTTADDDTPLLYVLTDELQLLGPRFGCGLAQCGSCSVLVDGVETRACVTPVSILSGKKSPPWKASPVSTPPRPDSRP